MKQSRGNGGEERRLPVSTKVEQEQWNRSRMSGSTEVVAVVAMAVVTTFQKDKVSLHVRDEDKCVGVTAYSTQVPSLFQRGRSTAKYHTHT